MTTKRKSSIKPVLLIIGVIILALAWTNYGKGGSEEPDVYLEITPDPTYETAPERRPDSEVEFRVGWEPATPGASMTITVGVGGWIAPDPYTDDSGFYNLVLTSAPRTNYLLTVEPPQGYEGEIVCEIRHNGKRVGADFVRLPPHPEIPRDYCQAIAPFGEL